MTVYMVERSLKGISMTDLGGAQKAAIAQARKMSEDGIPVSYLRSTFVPEDGRCMCLFEAGDAATVRKVNDEAGIPYDRVTEALDLHA
jgi:hypothetical protein